jgi:hypothetical protein
MITARRRQLLLGLPAAALLPPRAWADGPWEVVGPRAGRIRYSSQPGGPWMDGDKAAFRFPLAVTSETDGALFIRPADGPPFYLLRRDVLTRNEPLINCDRRMAERPGQSPGRAGAGDGNCIPAGKSTTSR